MFAELLRQETQGGDGGRGKSSRGSGQSRGSFSFQIDI